MTSNTASDFSAAWCDASPTQASDTKGQVDYIAASDAPDGLQHSFASTGEHVVAISDSPSWDGEDFCPDAGSVRGNVFDHFAAQTDNTASESCLIGRKNFDTLVNRGEKVAPATADAGQLLAQLAHQQLVKSSEASSSDPTAQAMQMLRLMQLEQVISGLSTPAKAEPDMTETRLRPTESAFRPRNRTDFSDKREVKEATKRRSYRRANRFRIGAMAATGILSLGMMKFVKSEHSNPIADLGLPGQHAEELQAADLAAELAAEAAAKTDTRLASLLETPNETAFGLGQPNNLER